MKSYIYTLSCPNIQLFKSWGFDLLNFTTHNTFNPFYNKKIKKNKMAIVDK